MAQKAEAYIQPHPVEDFPSTVDKKRKMDGEDVYPAGLAPPVHVSHFSKEAVKSSARLPVRQDHVSTVEARPRPRLYLVENAETPILLSEDDGVLAGHVFRIWQQVAEANRSKHVVAKRLLSTS